jgi:hypothetical protein
MKPGRDSNKIRTEKGVNTTNTNDIQRIIREHFESLYSNELENLEQINQFPDVLDLPNRKKGI